MFLYSRVDHFIAFYRSWVTNYAFRAKRCHGNFQIQLKTIDLRTRLWEKTTEFVGFIPQSLMQRFIVLSWISIYRNWSLSNVKLYSNAEISLQFRSNLSPILLTLWYENKHGGTVNKVDFKHIWSTFSRWQLSVLMRLKTGRKRQ